MNEHQLRIELLTLALRIECLTLALRHVSPDASIEAITEFADQFYKFTTKKSPSLPVSS